MSQSYRLRQTPQFKEDFKEALRYISISLRNSTAAESLLEEFEQAAEHVRAYPFSMQPYPTNRPCVYRAIKVKNFFAFYVVMDDIVEFRRFLYSRANVPAKL